MTNVWGEIGYGLRMLCGKPSPVKRFIAVLILGGTLAVVHIWFVVSSIYNMGVHDAKKQFLELQHIESLKLQQSKNDSINILNHKKHESK